MFIKTLHKFFWLLHTCFSLVASLMMAEIVQEYTTWMDLLISKPLLQCPQSQWHSHSTFSQLRPLQYPLVNFAFRSLVVGSYLKISHVPQENPQQSTPVDVNLLLLKMYMDLSLKDACSSNTLHKFFWLLHTCLIGSFINDGKNRPTVHNMNGSAHQQTPAAMSPIPVTFASFKNRWSVTGKDALNDLTNGTKTSTSCFGARMISFQSHHVNPPSKRLSNERYEGACILATKCHCH